ncbi:hypothetical protein DP113_16930 [Brasilonema octagenarum UFV-E1]|uniref:Uncharacterized protein n=1 Tax=Brasilonema sennae CENA114 TaxID=415709 RepID=A0A856MGI6_9CYAN|nr:hypothetical protein DP114_16995 [Brasilonema sennae CENA114]QDL15730.1 hypothetical protein DP113_16930 [Brasilonema octagenarum UFV-E1]
MGEPQRQIPTEGNPPTGLAPSGFTSRLRRETLSEVATTRGTRARHNSWQRWIHRKALLSAQKWHMRETLPQRWTHQMPAEGDPPAAGCRHLLQYWLPNAVPPEKLTRVRFNGLGL